MGVSFTATITDFDEVVMVMKCIVSLINSSIKVRAARLYLYRELPLSPTDRVLKDLFRLRVLRHK